MFDLAVVLVAVAAATFLVGRRRRRDRDLTEDILKYVYERAYRGHTTAIEGLCGLTGQRPRRVVGLLERLERAGLIDPSAPDLRLTPDGEREALRLIRNHRLWETHLKEFTGHAPSDWHAVADASEHRLDTDEVNRIEAKLGYPRVDPHGDPIPSADGDLDVPGGVPLNTVESGTCVRVVHVEDEPPERFAKLEGLYPGLLARVERSGDAIRLVTAGPARLLSPVAANAVTVERVEADIPDTERLCDVPVGLSARVVGISTACSGPSRRRLLDLGIVGGTRIEPVHVSPLGDPTAYRVRDSLIALRHNDAMFVRVHPGAPE